MNQALPTADLNTAGTTDVIPSVAIDRIIAQRNEGIALFMQAMECLATARRILLDASGDIFLYGFEDCVTDSVRCMDKPEEAKRNIIRLADRKIWDRLMTDTGMYTLNRPGFPGECFICELRLPDHRFRWKHNKLFLLLPEGCGPAFPAIVDYYTSPPT